MSTTRPPSAFSVPRSLGLRFLAYCEELHRWRGIYGRRALWARPAPYIIGLLAVQFLLGAWLIWFLLLLPLVLLSCFWVAAAAAAKRLRNLRHHAGLWLMAWLALTAGAGFAYVGLGDVARALFWAASLASGAGVIYIAFAPGKSGAG